MHVTARSRLARFASLLGSSTLALTVTGLALAAAARVGNPGPVSWTLDHGSELKLGAQAPVALGANPPSSFNGTVDDAGNVVLPASAMRLEPIAVNAMGMAFTAQLIPLADGTGTVDPATGKTTVNGRFKVKIAGSVLSGGCAVPEVEAHLSTDTAGGVPYDQATGRATLVANDFPVPAATGCGFFGGTLNRQLGLPAAAGASSLKLVVYATPILVAPPPPPVDAGEPDAGSDAGDPDAGADAGDPPDAGSDPDAGVDPETGP